MVAARPEKLEKHGHVRIDNYYWLNDREDPEVIAYLEEENAHTDEVMAPTSGLQEKLFQEIKDRIQETDQSVPYKKDDFWYYVRTIEGGDYPIHCRKKGSLEGDEQVMLDGNEMGKDKEYFSIGGLSISSGQNILAWAEDVVGRRIHNIYFKDLDTGEILPDVIENVTGNMAWANDNQTLFYSRQDLETLRSYQIYRHKLGTDPAGDALVYEEGDDTFDCAISKTRSKQFLFIFCHQTISSEVHILDADQPESQFRLFLKRERGHEYELYHFKDHFYILTNKPGRNFGLMRTPINQTAPENWEEVIAHKEDTLIDLVETFQDHLVVEERFGGLAQLRIRPWDGSEEHYVDFGEPAYSADIGINMEFNTSTFRFTYTSLTTPWSTYEYDMNSRQKTLLKRDAVLGDFRQEDYVTERLHAPARDGALVPISLVYRKEHYKPGKNPLMLYGYGSYGHNIDPYFSVANLNLLNRGFVYAIAHIRGSQTMGRHWYDDGRKMTKKNSFYDFIDCGRYLVEQKYSHPDKLFGTGGSAGGLLMGAVMNMAPQMWRGIVTHVPFVDVITTMLDPNIPLTTSEYDEWGNPNEKEAYEYILSYSPYDQVSAQDYPNTLVVTGLHDSQVQYWEPAKWVAKLRELKTNDNLLLLRTNMSAGHSGASGRYERYREIAFDQAFVLQILGISE